MIVVTGAAGFVGEAVVGRLLKGGRKVLALTHGKAFQVHAGKVALDLTNARDCEKLVYHCVGCKTLIHLAGKIDIKLAAANDRSGVPRAVGTQFSEMYEANVLMTARLLEVSLQVGIEHILFASSQSVYGLPAAPVVDEGSALAPLEYYAASKVASESLLALWARGNDRKATVLRFPGVWSEARRTGTVHELCKQATQKGSVCVGADIPLPIDVLHCHDVASAFEAAIGRPGGGWRAYNISTGEPCSLPLLAADIAALVPGCTVHRFGVPQPEITMDCARAGTELGWKAVPRRERLASYLGRLGVAPQHD